MIEAKAVIFDLDCTLVYTLKRFYEVFNELLKERGDKLLTWRKFLEHYIADDMDDLIAARSDPKRGQKLHSFWLEFLRMYRQADPDGELIPGAKEILRQLHRADIPIAVITSCITPAIEIRKELMSLGLSEFVDAVATGYDTSKDLEKGEHFSKARIIELAAERLGVDPKECVVVGDYWNDIRDGKALGARTIAVLTGLMKRELLEKFNPDSIIESVRDLPKVVKFKNRILV